MELQGTMSGYELKVSKEGLNETVISLKIPHYVDVSQLDGLLDIELKKHREKRSLDANAYAWVLMQKLAEKTHTDKWSVYLQCLQNYSKAFTHIIVKENAVEAMKKLYRTCVDLGEISVNGMAGHQLQVYYGSSTFNTQEMSVFIDGIVMECKDYGIETMTPNELAEMKNLWRENDEH